jgi:hypothetical protein
VKCIFCGNLVFWEGPLTDLSHTRCSGCGRQDCQAGVFENLVDPDVRPDLVATGEEFHACAS